MELRDEEIPPHSVIDSHFDPRQSSVLVMCHGTRFDIRVSLKDLRSSRFEHQYLSLVEKVHGGDGDLVDDYEALCDWILEPCFARFRELAPRPRDLDFSLQDYYFPDTYFLKLVVLNESLCSERVRGRRAIFSSALMVPTRSLPQFQGVPRIKATQVRIVPNGDDHWCEIPQKVRTADGHAKYFKPSFDNSQFIREVETFMQVTDVGFAGDFRISKLHGIVVSQDEKMTLGLLIDWIASIGNLQSENARQAREHHAKWKKQVSEIVEALHARDIVWGDVHPGNIVIDVNLDAWVVDFGGGWVEEFVARDKAGTKEGDWLGVQRIFEQLE